MSHSLFRTSDGTLHGFQSLSNKETLQLRAGVAPKEPHPTKYVAPQWCPSIDVLAVPEGKSLRLVRLSGGQTIWRRQLNDQHSRTAAKALFEANGGDGRGTADGQTIRAIAWHPTSMCLAVLHSDGTLVQRDATGGDVVHESKVELGDGELVAAMEWIRCDASQVDESGSDEGRQSLEHYLPRLTSADRSKALPSHVNPSTEPLTAIIIVTAAGRVIVSLGGVFTLPVAGAPKELVAAAAEGSTYGVVNTKLNEKDHRLYVVFSVQPSPAAESARLVVCALNMPLFMQTSGDLSRFTMLFARLSGLCLYLESALDVLIKESEARAEAASRAMLLDSLESVLRDHGVDEVTSPEAELIRLVVSGRASESVSQFLLSKMKAAKLSSWESAGRLGAVAIVRVVYQHIQPAIERAILAISEIQPIIGGWANTLTGGSGQLAGTSQALERAIVVWGWLFARFEDFMAAVCEEQRENQEFADWASFAIDDLHWQNEGSRRVDNDDSEDGSRPVRPDFDYELLLRFIRSAFHRETDLVPVDRSLLRMLYGRRARTARDKELLSAYINELFKAKGGDAEHLEFVFHSEQLANNALASCGLHSAGEGGAADTIRPTCQELLGEAKEHTLGALKWPSNMLGDSVSWDPAPLASLDLEAGLEDAEARRVSDIRNVDGGSCVYVATTVASSRTLELVMLPCQQSGAPWVAQIDLAVGPSEPALETASTPVQVADVSFFDDNLLGVAFTIGGSDSLYLGAIEYRLQSGETTLTYHATTASSTSGSMQPTTKSPLVFMRLLEINEASSSHSVALACNGNVGRRCIAVVERRGKNWWPYDMDNEEDESDDED
ncbi:anaphase promoting complex subunit 4 [Coemansia spiralis]|uniref:Anaphase-promoting complex subunit 4 n=1 Tax=Coemansia spiralis TaxID=417178 RepID=A0A9W8GKR4_9FUNG|nr:anaphase promoting complex subunit 4 [Coemansia spiralis]